MDPMKEANIYEAALKVSGGPNKTWRSSKEAQCFAKTQSDGGSALWYHGDKPICVRKGMTQGLGVPKILDRMTDLRTCVQQE